MFRLKSLRDYFRVACEYKEGKLQLEKAYQLQYKFGMLFFLLMWAVSSSESLSCSSPGEQYLIPRKLLRHFSYFPFIDLWECFYLPGMRPGLNLCSFLVQGQFKADLN